MDVGDIAYTFAKNLPCTYIIHTVCPNFNIKYFRLNCEESLKKCVTECLDRMNLFNKTEHQHNVKSISIPLLATGPCGFAPKKAAAIILRTCVDWLHKHWKNCEFESIRLCCRNEGKTAAFKDRMDKLYRNIDSRFPPDYEVN